MDNRGLTPDSNHVSEFAFVIENQKGEKIYYKNQSSKKDFAVSLILLRNCHND